MEDTQSVVRSTTFSVPLFCQFQGQECVVYQTPLRSLFVLLVCLFLFMFPIQDTYIDCIPLRYLTQFPVHEESYLTYAYSQYKLNSGLSRSVRFYPPPNHIPVLTKSTSLAGPFTKVHPFSVDTRTLTCL